MEDHFLPVLPALKARREHCDAMVCAMSAGEVMRLTRMGKFSMDKPASGALALLKRLRGKTSTQDNKTGATAGAQQMKMLRRLPKILRFIPGTAQDVRAYFLTLQYWLAGSQENIGNLVHILVRPLRRRPARGAARRWPSRRRRWSIPRSASTTRAWPATACTTACRPTSASCRAWPPAASAARSACCVHALLPAGRQRRPLRRRDHRARGARPARHPGLRHRAGLAPGDRAVLLRRTAAAASTRWSR